MKNKKVILSVIIAFIGKASFSQSLADFDSIVNVLNLENSPGYSILVSKGDSIIYQNSLGLADIETKSEITQRTKFRIASNTKQFTAICILQLVEKRKLELSTQVNQFLPFVSKKITIEHLLTHTSGLPSYDDKDLTDAFYQKDFNSYELVHLIENDEILSKPDKEYYYNNTGYHILGYIIEQITGLTYQTYLQENIFNPLGLTETHYESSKSNISTLAKGYEQEDSIFHSSIYYSMDQPYSAGSIVSTPSDLVKWNTAIFSHRFISDSLLKLAHQPYHLKDGRNTHYGYGWAIGELQGSTKISHSGYLEGFNSTLFYLPNSEISVVVISNCTCLNTDKLANRLGAVAIQKPIVEKKNIQLALIELYKFEGEYDIKEAIMTFKVVENTLTFKMDDSEEYKIYPENKYTFFSNDLDCTIEFSPNQDSLTLRVDLRETVGVKLITRKNKHN